MIFLQLYTVFLKIGAFAFGGGYAVLPLISRFIIEEQHWLSVKGLTDLVSLSQMTPGPIAINSATFIGTKVAGLPGAIVATLGNITPQCILMMILGYVLFRGRKIRFLDKILKGLKPAIVGLIAVATVSMLQSSLWHMTASGEMTQLSLLGCLGFVLGFTLYRKKKADLIRIVLFAAVFGIVLHLLFAAVLGIVFY